MSEREKLPDEYWTQYAEETEMITCPACGAINLAGINQVCWKCGKELKGKDEEDAGDEHGGSKWGWGFH